jgi:hypothetical protein
LWRGRGAGVQGIVGTRKPRRSTTAQTHSGAAVAASLSVAVRLGRV